MGNRIVKWLVLLCTILLLSACGAASQEKVLKKVNGKWAETNGYELNASMEIKSGGEPRNYDVTVWHTKPDFYRVEVVESGKDVSQMIVRNADGVFVVTPTLNKMYKFQSDWPKKNSQAYLIGALAEDLAEDKNLVMKEEEKAYIFEAATRNSYKNSMPHQVITVDKKTLLPTSVAIMNDVKEEQIRITFKKIKLGVQHAAKEYAVEQFTDKDSTKGEQATPADKEGQEGKDEKEAVGAEVEYQEFQTHYPVLNWAQLANEKVVQENGMERVILTFDGEKAFTVMQQPVTKENSMLPVSSPGDPVDLGYTIGAITDTSISWEKDGVEFFVASSKLTREEMIEVATSMTISSMK
ncbi:MAG TPA: outer membrane lipoprotein carrier protein LolA [Lysinibacillus sp.]|uniref:Outer membrane lipoprotein carrier protein LolA n=1 Tax=Lysinibacillus fusiformis TaxID=28031 RepID=A0A2I0UX50_9BACI|nr:MULTISPECIES: outer membrane lipoprotein carrier protein LolA [Lysinibacillus]HBT74251.1 outer membrane lipoprotein carrier protein LolA [Lysinibacillus sp.]KUF29828.1 sporulation protein [Lysinibacillus sp. F5]MEE3809840.1 outer membrane lipoprotein carrier protein LolA [Lysinibacillus fusiformis]PKU50634.1 outer membrane lipoprotein carrier protein LolA [Lysinibacillus fusiformis]WCH47405.1 outer membrane lipoprotein carrier protein LolA [Lysinibacillus sp. OF-1]